MLYVPTIAQAAVIDTNREVFCFACPGAGKTRTLVERARKLLKTKPPRKAIALLSFTNSAVDEFVLKCNKYDCKEILEYPNYIGTLDSFIRKFIVCPNLNQKGTNPIRTVNSYNDIDARISINSLSFEGLPLSLFDFHTGRISDETIEALDRMDSRKRALKDKLKKDKLFRSSIEERAKKFRYVLNLKGIYSADDIRSLVKLRLTGSDKWEYSNALKKMISSRFYEIILDEAQDCDGFDVRLIRWLRSGGIRVSVVGDPDQAIYEFRRGGTGDLGKLREDYDSASRRFLSDNFRCSPAIVRFSSTLRNSRKVDNCAGDSKNYEGKVILAAYSTRNITSRIGERFSELSSLISIAPKERILLSHRWKDAAKATGSKWDEGSNGTGRILLIAKEVKALHSNNSSPRERERSIVLIEKLLLKYMDCWKESDLATSDVLERELFSDRELRRSAYTIVSNLNIPVRSHDDTISWISKLRILFEENSVIKVSKSAKRFFPTPKTSTLNKLFKILNKDSNVNLQFSSVHESKGHEFESVCLVLPPRESRRYTTDRVVENWINNKDCEHKRVLYVGATRAKRLLMIAYPKTLSKQIKLAVGDDHSKFDFIEL